MKIYPQLASALLLTALTCATTAQAPDPAPEKIGDLGVPTPEVAPPTPPVAPGKPVPPAPPVPPAKITKAKPKWTQREPLVDEWNYPVNAKTPPRRGQEIVRQTKLKVLQKHYEQTLNETIQLEKAAISAAPDDRAKMEEHAKAMRNFVSKLESDLEALGDQVANGWTTSEPSKMRYESEDVPSAKPKYLKEYQQMRGNFLKTPPTSLDTKPDGASEEQPKPLIEGVRRNF
jgi:hypothetical protein